MESVRLQKYFTDCAILSRRAAEDKIRAGEVKVNGEVATLGQKIDPERDVVEYNGKIIKPSATEKHYVLLYKPRGVVTTLSDEKGRTTVANLVADLGVRVYPVGRLDMDSDGLLILTDDGALTERLTHPRHEIPKHYHVTVSGVVTPAQLAALNSSFLLDGYTTRPAKVSVVRAESGETVLSFELYEGRNRQIRRMCDQVGLRVRRLSRVAIGNIGIGDLVPGRYRLLTEEELAYLRGEEKKEQKTEKAAAPQRKTRSTKKTAEAADGKDTAQKPKKKAGTHTHSTRKKATAPTDTTEIPAKEGTAKQTPKRKNSVKAATEAVWDATEAVWDALSIKHVEKAAKDIINATMKPLTKRSSKPKAQDTEAQAATNGEQPPQKSTRQSSSTRSTGSTSGSSRKRKTATQKQADKPDEKDNNGEDNA